MRQLLQKLFLLRFLNAKFGTKASCQGFSLIEAVLALAILSIGIFVLIEATSQCLSVIRVSKTYQTAREVLEQGELDYPLCWTNSIEDNTVASVEYPGGFTFFRNLDQVDGEEDLFIVTRRVTWSETGQSSFEEVVGYLYCQNHE